jgi:hypothetical protein
MGEGIPLFPRYAFKTWTRTVFFLTDLFCFYVRVLCRVLKSRCEVKHVTEKHHS